MSTCTRNWVFAFNLHASCLFRPYAHGVRFCFTSISPESRRQPEHFGSDTKCLWVVFLLCLADHLVSFKSRFFVVVALTLSLHLFSIGRSFAVFGSCPFFCLFFLPRWTSTAFELAIIIAVGYVYEQLSAFIIYYRLRVIVNEFVRWLSCTELSLGYRSGSFVAHPKIRWL